MKRSSHIFLPLVATTAAQFAPQVLLACPMCHSGTAAEVRAGIISASFDGIAVPALILPFVGLALVVCVIHIDWQWPSRKKFTLRKWNRHG